MRFYRKAIVLVAVLVVLIGAYFLIDKFVSIGDKGTSTEIELVQLELNKVNRFTIKNDDGDYSFEKKDYRWEIVSGGDFQADVSRIESIVSSITRLNANRIIEENPQDKEKYGLTDPFVLSISTVDGDSVTVQIGNATATKEGYYITLNESNTVYTIPSYVGSSLKATKTDLRNKYILDYLSTQVIELGLEREGSRVFHLERIEQRQWLIKEPIEYSANLINITGALDALVRTHAWDYVEENPEDLSIYGLDNPLFIVEAKAEDGYAMRLYIGDKKGMNFDTYVIERYAMLEGKNEVFLIDIDPLRFLNKSAFDFVDTYVYAGDIDSLESSDVYMREELISIRVDRSDETEKYYVNDKEINEEGERVFREFYRTLTAIEVVDLDIESIPEGDVDIFIQHNLNRTPGQVKFEFISKDDTSYYVVKDGNYTGLIIEKQAFNVVRSVYGQLLEFTQN
ncbi:UNVERIFIED_CONTAM: uncharacterized protein DUF4340 [Acetivibrio alkalicellulosi]